jgi:hypothetical protein
MTTTTATSGATRERPPTRRWPKLAPQRTRYFFRTLYVAAMLIKALGRERAVALSAPRLLPLQRLVAFGFGLEDRLVGAIPVPGLSLICIARRPRLGTRFQVQRLFYRRRDQNKIFLLAVSVQAWSPLATGIPMTI